MTFNEISVSSKYEALGHDLLVIANVFVCICSYLKTPASLLSESLCMSIYESACVCKRGRKRCFSSQTRAEESMSLLQPVFIHTMHIFSSKGAIRSHSVFQK